MLWEKALSLAPHSAVVPAQTLREYRFEGEPRLSSLTAAGLLACHPGLRSWHASQQLVQVALAPIGEATRPVPVIPAAGLAVNNGKVVSNILRKAENRDARLRRALGGAA